MITPDILISELINNVLIPAKASLGITDAIELSNDFESKNAQPPYLAIFEDFTEDVQTANADGSPILFPTEISIIVSSSAFKTLQEATSEAYIIAGKVLKLVPGSYTLINTDSISENLFLRSKKLPIEIMTKSRQQTLLKLTFKYDMDMR